MARPLAVDLFCRLGGWTEGLLAEGWDVVGFDIERHEYGEHRYPAQLVLQDVLTLHGSQFKDAALIVASPPCQEYSYMAMPWTLAKAKAAAIRADTSGQKLADLNRLFDACFRIQAQASLATGRHVPLVVENVRGAIPWVGRSRWNFGSYHLWGDVPALMPFTAQRRMKSQISCSPRLFSDRIATTPEEAHALHYRMPDEGTKHDGSGWRANGTLASCNRMVPDGFKSHGMNWSDRSKRGQDFTRIAGLQAMSGLKQGGDWFNQTQPSISRLSGGKSSARAHASAMIAKIPLPLSRHIAAVYRG